MKSHSRIIGIMMLSLLLGACSSPKEEMKEEPPPPTPAPTMAPPVEAAPIYKYNERYLVPAASIAGPTDFTDPLQALRVIQVRQGTNHVLVIFSNDQMVIDGRETPVETWFGIEMRSFAPGTYNLATDTKQMKFYRIVLSNKAMRFDGEQIDGTLEIKEYDGTSVSGFINANIKGMTKGFTEANHEFALSFSGSFQIDRVDLENTLMGR